MPDITYIKLFVDYLDAIEPLGDAERGRLFTALLEYTRTGAAPQLGGNERFLFPMMRAQIDRDKAEYKDYCEKQAKNGRKGGRPRKNSKISPLSEKPMAFSETQKSQDKGKDKDNIPPKSPQGESESFLRFWNAYPRKINRGKAWQAWKKLCPDDELANTIMSAVKEQSGSAQWQQENGRFIPSPDRWLSESRWKDELTPAAANKSYDMGELEQLANLRLPDEL